MAARTLAPLTNFPRSSAFWLGIPTLVAQYELLRLVVGEVFFDVLESREEPVVVLLV